MGRIGHCCTCVAYSGRRKIYAMADTDLGTRIRRARERKRWTQEQLAAELEVGPRSVGRWERGEAVPRSSIGALEQVLGVSLADDDDQDPNEDVLRTLDMEPQRLSRLVEAYRRIMQDGASPRRERAG